MIGQSYKHIVTALLLLLLSNFSVQAESKLAFTQQSLSWQQVDAVPSFTVFSNRDIYSNLDKDGRIVFVVQVGNPTEYKLYKIKVKWSIKKSPAKKAEKKDTKPVAGLDDIGKDDNDNEPDNFENELLEDLNPSLAQSTISLRRGLGSVSFDVADLPVGEYLVNAVFLEDKKIIAERKIYFVKEEGVQPARKGEIPILFPAGVPFKEGTYPITCGVPFPKGALYSSDNVQLLNASGKIIPCQTIVRSRWGISDKSSIRWLGLDFQTHSQPAWNRKSEKGAYHLQYGPKVKLSAPVNPIKITDTGNAFKVNTGVAEFTIRKKGFNLFDKVLLDGKNSIANSANSGLYLVDQNGDTYRAANDRESSASIEERGPLRSVIRVAGWYVKDGATGETMNYTLPTDRLCKFITRLEFYAGKSYVRVLSTWIITFDIFSVRLTDLGLSIPLAGVKTAEFGIEKSSPFTCDVRGKGVYLLQHLHNQFKIVENDKTVKNGIHCGGWFSAKSANAVITTSLNETWQRYPKEFEVLSNAVRLHIWPAHGIKHPGINQLTHQNLTRIIYAHEGKEMNLPLPWKYYLAAAKIRDSGRTGVYSAAGQVLAGVHAGAMGAAITSDILIDFAQPKNAKNAVAVAECFQKKPHALADPKWNCATLAAGYLHPYDPKKFPVLERIIQNALKGYEKTNDFTKEYGMWIYRRWHHSDYLGDGKWNLYRFNNTTHHHEALMPWLFYFRSGDPFYLKQGEAHLRNMSDVGIIHYENNKYPLKEFHSGQKGLLGSTKHTNGFVPWGADHAVAAHLTCYDSLILAYYLTGDLRYKEIVVDEWQKTITERRDDPEYNRADRSIRTDGSIIAGQQKTGARDVDCFVGELLELNMLTHNPKVLAVLGPRLKVMENNPIQDWGMPLHNAILYYGSRKLRKDLTAFAKEFIATGSYLVNDPHMFWHHYGRSNSYKFKFHEPITLASIINNDDKNYASAAYSCAAPHYCDGPLSRIQWSENIKDLKPKATNFWLVPDIILKYPHLMYACSRAGFDISNPIVLNQPMPIGDFKAKGWNRILIKEKADQKIPLDIQGSSTIDIPLVALDPDGKLVLSVNIAAKASERKPVVIPKDGKSGVYSVFLHGKANATKLLVPISPLPEVYCNSYWSQTRPCRFFINIPKGWKRGFTIKPYKTPGIIANRKLDKALAQTTKGEALSVDMPPDGIWFLTKAHYINLLKQGIMAVSPERWFAPSKELMTQPVPKRTKLKK